MNLIECDSNSKNISTLPEGAQEQTLDRIWHDVSWYSVVGLSTSLSGDWYLLVLTINESMHPGINQLFNSFSGPSLEIHNITPILILKNTV